MLYVLLIKLPRIKVSIQNFRFIAVKIILMRGISTGYYLLNINRYIKLDLKIPRKRWVHRQSYKL
jgi:hypothetical protein